MSYNSVSVSLPLSLSDSSAHTPVSPECAEDYLSGYRLPMLVYVQDEEKTKHYATIKKDYAIRGWPATEDETLPEFVARVLLLDEPPSLENALKELVIAEGECAYTSLWYTWKYLPAYMDTVGITYLPEQEECREYFQETPLCTGLSCIVDGFPEDPIIYEDNQLFRVGARDCLTPQDAVFYVTVRSISFEEALAMILVHCPGKVGHGLSLREIFDTYSVAQQAIVGRLSADDLDELRKTRVIDQAEYYLKLIEKEPTRKDRADATVSLMEYLLTGEATWFVRKYDKFRQTVLDKCEALRQENGVEFPELVAICEKVTEAYLDICCDTSFPFTGAPPPKEGEAIFGAL